MLVEETTPDEKALHVIGRLFADLVKVSYSAEDGKHGDNADRILLGWLILMHQIEGRPITISRLSRLSGISRQTIYRRLDDAKQRGVCDQRADGSLIITETFIASHYVSRLPRLTHLVLTAAKKIVQFGQP